MQSMILTRQSSIAEILAHYPETIPVFIRHHMSCVGCSMSTFETVQDAARIYGLAPEAFIEELQQFLLSKACESQEFYEASPFSIAAPIPKLQEELSMSENYTFFPDINDAINSIPQESIVSRTVYRDDHLKAILFAFAPGQELSEHTASVPAIIQIVEGEADLTLGEDHYEVKAGAWARMPANLKHSVVARTPVKMLLTMLP